jgi:hypothetical protein
MKNVMIAAAVLAGVAFSSNAAFAYNWLLGGPGPNDYCQARAAQVHELPVGAGAALAASQDARNPLARSWAMRRVQTDPVLRSTIDSQGVPIAAVVDVQFYRDCSAVIFTAY